MHFAGGHFECYFLLKLCSGAKPSLSDSQALNCLPPLVFWWTSEVIDLVVAFIKVVTESTRYHNHWFVEVLNRNRNQNVLLLLS